MPEDRLLSIAGRVDQARVMARLAALAEINPGGPGISRPGYSDDERRAMALVAGWAAEAGAELSWDTWGNCFMLRPGRVPEAPVAAAGSHLDSVPFGGVYDGPLGVVGALEALTLLAEAGYTPRRGMELIAWTCEEPVRFAQGRVGSQLFGGQQTPATLVANDGRFDLAAWTGDNAPRPRRPDRAMAGYLELHIEQARQLEAAGVPVGVVTGISGSHRLTVDIRGRADHSGATPMGLRADALGAAAELILEIEALGRAEAERSTVATVGKIEVSPNAVNVVPGEVRLTPDIRSLDADSSQRVVDALPAVAARIAGRRPGVTIDVAPRSRALPVVFPTEIVDLVESAARDLGIAHRRMPSGAGHDGQSIAHAVPIGMVFVPSRDGVSHAPTEHTDAADCAAGARVLSLAWMRMADT